MPPEVAEQVSPDKLFDNRPYAMILHPRREEIRPLVDFEKILPWSVAPSMRENARFTRSFAEQLWGPHTGLLEFRLLPAGTWIPIELDVPLRTPTQFDCLDIWVMRTGKVPGENPQFRIVLTDDEGRRYETPARLLDWEGWGLLHWGLKSMFEHPPAGPLYIAAIEVQSGGPGRCDVYMDSLSAYREQLAPIRFSVAGSSAHEPEVPPKADGVHLVKLQEEMYALQGEANGHSWSWRFDPRYGGEGLEFWFDGRFVSRPLSASFLTGLQAGFPALIRPCENGLDVYYENGIKLRLRGQGRRISMEIESPGNVTEVVSMGRIEGCEAHEVTTPFIDASHRALFRLVRLAKPDLSQPLYLSFSVDPQFSASSELAAGATPDENGALLYYPDSSGRRPGLKEKWSCVVSERIEDVLPSAHQQPAHKVEQAASRIYMEATHEEVGTPQELFALPAWWPSSGLSNLVVFVSDRMWMDDGVYVDNHLSPLIGTAERLADSLTHLREQGAIGALPAQVKEISPLGARWGRSVMQREPDLAWRGEPSAYRLKSTLAQIWMPEIAAKWKRLYAAETLSVLGPGWAPPWFDTDYDERNPSAARWSQVVAEYSSMLTDLSEQMDGPVCCTGPGAWLYAGKADAVRPDGPDLPRQGAAWQPLFALYRLAPYSALVGLGSYQHFAQNSRGAPSESVDAYLAAQLAHGCAARLPASGVLSTDLQARMACMSLWVQQRRGVQTPQDVRYWDGRREVSCSEALASDVWLRSQLCLRYPSGLRLWINGHPSEPWTVTTEDKGRFDLPPFGYLVTGPDVFEFSGRVDGQRLDYLATPEALYLDGRGRLEPYQGLVAPTPLLVLKPKPDTWQLVDISGSGRFGFFGLTWNRVESVTWLNAKGEPIIIEPERVTGGWWITLPEGVRSATLNLRQIP